jgi:hypothetical protein
MEGVVCRRCGRSVTESEYSFGATECCNDVPVCEDVFDEIEYSEEDYTGIIETPW